MTQAKGSAYIEQGETKVVVSVFDPREIPNKTEYSLKGELYCQFKYAPFSCTKRRQHQQDAEEKQNTAIIKKALESAVCRHEFPNFQVDIYALVLENDGSAVAAAISAAGLALAHAGIPMYDLIAAATVCVKDEAIYLDPTVREEGLCGEEGYIVVSVLNTHEQISEMYQNGSMSLESLRRAVEVCNEAVKDIMLLVQKCLIKMVLKHVNRVKDGEEE